MSTVDDLIRFNRRLLTLAGMPASIGLKLVRGGRK
jgi:hypothetical protein